MTPTMPPPDVRVVPPAPPASKTDAVSAVRQAVELVTQLQVLPPVDTPLYVLARSNRLHALIVPLLKPVTAAESGRVLTFVQRLQREAKHLCRRLSWRYDAVCPPRVYMTTAADLPGELERPLRAAGVAVVRLSDGGEFASSEDLREYLAAALRETGARLAAREAAPASPRTTAYDHRPAVAAHGGMKRYLRSLYDSVAEG